MAFGSIVFKTDIDLWVRTRQPGDERIQAIKRNGELSPYGCGWNVMFALRLVTREQAQQGVDQIVQTHDEHGEAAHSGLLIGTADRPNSIAGIVHAKFGAPNLTYNRFRWEDYGMDNARIRQAIIERFLPSQRVRNEALQAETFMYVLIKYMLNFETGLGHTVLLRFERQPNGELAVSVLDPQLKTLKGFDETIQYITGLTANGRRRYQGIACLGSYATGGKRKTQLNRKNRSKRKTRKGGVNTLDPDMNHMTKDQEYQYTEMINDLKAWKSTNVEPFLYTPTMKPKNITISI